METPARRAALSESEWKMKVVSLILNYNYSLG